MIKTTRRSKAGFTLIELLTVIAIIGILAAIIIPTVGKVQQTARRTADSSNLRQIGQASLIFAQSSKDQLPASKLTNFVNDTQGAAATVKNVAGALAISGGLESGKMWVSKADDTTSKETPNSNVGSVLISTKTSLDPAFSDTNLAFGYVTGLNNNFSATTPVAFTRGIVGSTTGAWSETVGPYKTDGGHVVFLGGNVAFYKSLGTSATNGELIDSLGAPTNVITATIKSTKAGVRFLQEDAAGASSETAGTGL